MLKRWHLPVFYTAIFLGLLIAVQFRTQQQVRQNQQTTADRNVALLEVLNKSETERNALADTVSNLRRQIAVYEKMATEKEVITPGISAELDALRILTGSTPVEGAGITVTLDDRDSFDKIASSDLQDLVNILRYAGAEAVSVNGQRLIATSAIHEAGNNMLVNKTPVNRPDGIPYELQAIGDPATLSQLFRITNNLVGNLIDLKGVKVNIVEEKNIRLPAYTGGTVFTLARPVQG